MIYILNIVSPTKDNDILYKNVSVNTWPIVWISENLDSLWKNEDFLKTLKDIIKSKKVQNNAMIYCRVFDDNMTFIENKELKLLEEIKTEICQQ